MSLTDITGVPYPRTYGDKTYRVGPWTLYQLGLLQRFVDDAYRSPYDRMKEQVARLEIPPDVAEPLLAKARMDSLEWKPPQVSLSHDWADIFFVDSKATLWLLQVAFETHNPGFTLEQADELASVMTLADFAELIRIGMDMKPIPEGEIAPKSRPQETSGTNSPEASTNPGESCPTASST